MQLDHVQIVAPPDCERAARGFYGDVLGLMEIDKPPVLAARGGVWFSLEDGRELHIGVVAVEAFSPATRAHPAFRVELRTLEVLARRLIAMDHPFLWAPDDEIPGVRRLHTTDPWGNRLELLADA